MTRFRSVLAKSLLALLIACGTFATTMQAQDGAITVSVPFAFTVGSQSLAPGTYQFSLDYSALGSDQFLLSVLNVKTSAMELFDVLPQRQRMVEERGHLTFHTSADRHVLAEVHFPGTDTFSELSPRRPAGNSPAMQSSASKSVPEARRCECTAEAGAAAQTPPRSSAICTQSK